MRLATWNVNSLGARLARVQAWVEEFQPDVLCLQELKASIDQLPVWLIDLEGYWCYWHGDKGYSGVGLHIRKDACSERPAFFHPSFDFEHRIVTARLPELIVASVYVPNGGKDYAAKITFMKSLAEWARRVHGEGRSLVLCGDINITRSDMDVHPRERKPGIIGQRPEERELFDLLLSENLVDVGRALDPDNASLYTWWPPWRNMRARNIGWRIDYLLANRTLAERARVSQVRSGFGTSDHAPVVASFEG